MKIGGLKMEKEGIKLFFLTEGIVICRSPFEVYKNLLEIINEFNKIMEYNINTQKSTVILHSLNENLENKIC